MRIRQKSLQRKKKWKKVSKRVGRPGMSLPRPKQTWKRLWEKPSLLCPAKEGPVLKAGRLSLPSCTRKFKMLLQPVWLGKTSWRMEPNWWRMPRVRPRSSTTLATRLLPLPAKIQEEQVAALETVAAFGKGQALVSWNQQSWKMIALDLWKRIEQIRCICTQTPSQRANNPGKNAAKNVCWEGWRMREACKSCCGN